MTTRTTAIPLSTAARLVGVSPSTLCRRVSSGEISAITPPTDRRVRLLAVDDLRRIFGADAIPEDLAM